jgi:hypothetical protein
VLFVKIARFIQRPNPVQFFGEPIQWIERARYPWVTLDKQMTWTAHVNHIGKKAPQRLDVLDPLKIRRSGLSIRKLVLVYKQLIHPMMEYTCPFWRSVNRGGLMLIRPVEATHNKAAKTTQRIVSNTVRLNRLSWSVIFLSYKTNARV